MNDTTAATAPTAEETQLTLLRDSSGLTFAQAPRRLQLQRQRQLADEANELLQEAQQFKRHSERSATNFKE